MATSARRHPGLRRAGWYVALSAASLLVVFPVWMTLVRAVSQPFEYLDAGQPPWPVSIDTGVWAAVWSGGAFPRAMFVSLISGLLVTAGQLTTSVMAAYAFAYLEFPLKRLLFWVLLATMLLPIEVTLVANVRTIRELGWLNSWQGLSVPFMAAAFGIFLLRQAFLGIPRDLVDAARLDGFGHWAFLRRVALPATRPLIGSFVLITSLGAWSSYLWPRAITTEEDWSTVQVALKKIIASQPDRLNLGVAAAVMSAVPILILLLVFQKQIIRGLTAGSVKG